VTDPPDGLPIRSSDLLLAAFSVQQFEEEGDLLRRPASNTGATPRYERDAMYAWLTWFVFEKGVPETQTALVALVQDWFVQNSRSGEVPEESTIRKRLAALSRKLRGDDPVLGSGRLRLAYLILRRIVHKARSRAQDAGHRIYPCAQR
jgi:hypothetical protein